MDKRKITKLNQPKFKPFNKYGDPINRWSWHKISFNKKKKIRTYISKLDPITKIIPYIYPKKGCLTLTFMRGHNNKL